MFEARCTIVESVYIKAISFSKHQSLSHFRKTDLFIDEVWDASF